MHIRNGSTDALITVLLMVLAAALGTGLAACGGGGTTSACIAGQMVQIPAGLFRMGCSETVDPTCVGDDCPQISCQDDEFPFREVTLPAFEIDQCEVTVASYQGCVVAKACSEPSTYSGDCNWGVEGHGDHPINCIDWDQASAFCAWAGKRLCTETEWEKAARGGCEFYADCKADSPEYPWPVDPPSCDKAVYLGCNCKGTCEVGIRPNGASPYGVLDMAGNVWEWIQDTYHPSYDGAPDDGTSWEGGTNRMYRGGGWISKETGLRVTNRVEYKADGLTDALGFRCCK
ncbi:MAG: formylglycine-generating enzyme family protein [Deltaproteobacteria bacterium]|nr:formylglycine-generating enzyme family protein [Deltaproteobacteria bacterium]